MAKKELRVTSTSDNGKNITFSDGSRVGWDANPSILSCNCTMAARCQVDKQLCNHILHVVRNRIDNLNYPAHRYAMKVNLPVSLPVGPDQKKVKWTEVLLAVNEGDQREMFWIQTQEVVGFISAGRNDHICRRDIRELLWPFMAAHTLKVQCERCVLPASIQAFESKEGRISPGNQAKAIRDMLFILEGGTCEFCTTPDNDLVPNV